MDLQRTLNEINKDREKTEASFVFCLWKDPELYDDYRLVNEGRDNTIRTEDAVWYFNLGKAMYKQGYKNFDNLTIETFISGKPNIKKKFEEYGGYAEVKQFKDLVDTSNTDAYFDAIKKINALDTICRKYEDLFNNVSRFENASSEDIYNTFDLLNNSVSLNTDMDSKVEDLVIDDKFIDDCKNGVEVGLNYGMYCPLLNYTTLGLPLGDMFMIASHSGLGKSSFIFENITMPLNLQGVKVGILSNEMRADAYKHLLLIHILTKDLNYWNLTRKKIKQGKFTDEDIEMIEKAKEISKEKYGNIRFVKLFSNEIGRTIKYIKKLAHQGYQCIIWDTMKSDDEVDDLMWQQLTMNSRRVFQIASKNNISIVTTYQLALHTQNQRYLDASCLSNAKQIKEVFSEMIYFRALWRDEYTGEKYDCKPYKVTKTEEGTNVKTFLDLDPEKKYIVAFVDKTRNDEDKQTILYEFNGRFNYWKEIGRCSIFNDHRM